MNTELELSQHIENMLVARNPRGMQSLQQVLTPGYYLRAAKLLQDCKGRVLIGTGFPVNDTFETDGPVGAIALYQTLQSLGAKPMLVCGEPLATVLAKDFTVLPLALGKLEFAEQQAHDALIKYQPVAVVSIERPGLTANNRYENMRGEDISVRCACFDYFLKLADCPTIAIGDGGNEIGMGNVVAAVEKLAITPAVTTCDELLVADVSNWGAYGLIALLSRWQQKDLLAFINVSEILSFLSANGSVDGVTRENTLTEDGLALSVGEGVITALRALIGFADGKEVIA